MNSITPKKFEKVDEHTLRIIAEKIDEIDLGILVSNQGVMRDQVKQFENKLKVATERLAHIDMLIDEAKKLGIKEEEKDVNPQKPKK